MIPKGAEEGVVSVTEMKDKLRVTRNTHQQSELGLFLKAQCLGFSSI